MSIFARTRSLVVVTAICSVSQVATGEGPELIPNWEAPRLAIRPVEPATTLANVQTAPEAVSEVVPQSELPTIITDASDATESQIEVVRERFANGNVRIQREVTLDAESNYVNHGDWKMWNQKGEQVAEGRYVLGKRHGPWMRILNRQDAASLKQEPLNKFQPPFSSQATFENGDLHGSWLILDAKQRKCIQIDFEHGQRHGQATIWGPQGNVLRQMTFFEGRIIGDVIERQNEGKMQKVATYIDGRRILKKATNYPGTKKRQTEAHFISEVATLSQSDDYWNVAFASYETPGDVIRHGAWKTWYQNGQLHLEGFYRHGKETGDFTWWHPNGQKAVAGKFEEGKQQGEWTWWHPNGLKASTGAYFDGRQVGLWRSWSESGKMAGENHFDLQDAAEEPKIASEPELREDRTSQKFPKLPWIE